MALLNPTLSADEALALGLITRVVDDAALQDASMEIARKLAAGPTKALGAARALIIEGLGRSYDEQLEAEARAMVETALDDDGRRRVAQMHASRVAGIAA
jgi:2-(1,2-epoxy-1,2-dihydrophenyl)acetyl-CoA isomerase